MTGASVTSSGTITMDYSGYLPTGAPLIFQVECGTKVSPPMSVTICNILPEFPFYKRFSENGNIGIP